MQLIMAQSNGDNQVKWISDIQKIISHMVFDDDIAHCLLVYMHMFITVAMTYDCFNVQMKMIRLIMMVIAIDIIIV